MRRREFLQGGALLAVVSSCSRHRAPSEADSLSEVVRRIASGETQAADYFKLALSTNVYEFVEHRYARIELQLLRMSVVDHHDAP